MSIRTPALVAALLLAGAVSAAPRAPRVPEVVVDEQMIKSCAECHGAAGIASAPGTPHLGGQTSDYLQQEISGLANGDRRSTIADHVPKSWTEQDIVNVSKFYARSKAPRPEQTTDAAKVAQGEALYSKRCSECHTNKGRGSDKDAPLMAGQNLEYLTEQTRLYLAGKRRFPFLMDDAYKGLKADELEAITHFFASQR
jgi:cytochrome subunit of sulfide dehydrogenase